MTKWCKDATWKYLFCYPTLTPNVLIPIAKILRVWWYTTEKLFKIWKNIEEHGWSDENEYRKIVVRVTIQKEELKPTYIFKK